MRRRGNWTPGFALHELLLVVAFLAILAGITVPIFYLAVSRARTTGVAEALGATIRDARTRATLAAGGFQYRVVAFSAGGARPNSFRIEAWNPSAGLWPAPADTTPSVCYGATSICDPFVDLAREFPGTQILVPGGTFTVTFDSSGQWPGPNPCFPAACQVQVISGERTAIITVSAAGAVRIDK